MHRFFVDREIGDMGAVELDAEESSHAARTLRLRVGDAVRVFDAAGVEYEAEIAAISPKRAVLALRERLPPPPDPGIRLTLGVSLIRAEPMAFLVQKATELGVYAIAPLVCERTERAGRDAGETTSARALRWRRISIAACKQCGRNRPIEVHEAANFEAWTAAALASSVRIVAAPAAKAFTLSQILEQRVTPSFMGPPAEVVVAIGPEGGLTEAEQLAAAQAGFIAARLGRHVLRAETAALAVAAVVLERDA